MRQRRLNCPMEFADAERRWHQAVEVMSPAELRGNRVVIASRQGGYGWPAAGPLHAQDLLGSRAQVAPASKAGRDWSCPCNVVIVDCAPRDWRQ